MPRFSLYLSTITEKQMRALAQAWDTSQADVIRRLVAKAYGDAK